VNNLETEILISDLRKYWIKDSVQLIHCGAHLAEELGEYLSKGFKEIIWIEAMPEVFENLREKVSPIDGNIAINACLWSTADQLIEFNVSSNSYSSSILDFGTHAKTYPEIKWERKIQLHTTTLDTLEFPSSDEPIFLVLDLQGAEYQALLGATLALENTDYIYVEVSKNLLYKDSANWDAITKFLRNRGFKLVDWQYSNNLGWGNAFYVKNAPTISSYIIRQMRKRSHRLARNSAK
jgi:FkbM family methyltransferase